MLLLTSIGLKAWEHHGRDRRPPREAALNWFVQKQSQPSSPFTPQPPAPALKRDGPSAALEIPGGLQGRPAPPGNHGKLEL